MWKLSSVPKVTRRETRPWGVGHLTRDDTEEELITRRQLLEVKVHLLQGLDEDDVEPAPPINEGLGGPGSVHCRFNDEWVGPRI
jgi:hypothetical protein